MNYNQTLPHAKALQEPNKELNDIRAQIIERNSRIQIDKSTIPDAGFGVFALKTIKPWTNICKYGGQIYSNISEMKFAKKTGESDAAYYSPTYLTGIIGSKTTYGPLINDPRDETKLNCRIVYSKKQFRVIALESEIEIGEELFLSYGEDYWKKF